jgi:hypothetical protein
VTGRQLSIIPGSFAWEFSSTLGGWLRVRKPLILLLKIDNPKGEEYPDKFRNAVKGVPQTLILFKSAGGGLCGGFMSVPWPGRYTRECRDPAGQSFLFVLRNRHGDKPARGMSRKGIVCYAGMSNGPGFGSWDLGLDSEGEVWRNDARGSGFDNPIPGRGRHVFFAGGHETCRSYEVWKVA